MLEQEGLLEEFKDNPKYSGLIGELNKKYQSTEMLNTVLDSTPCTISWISKDLKYLGANKALLEALKLDKNNFVGTSMGDLTKDPAFLNFAKVL